jgi:hypothetical protein
MLASIVVVFFFVMMGESTFRPHLIMHKLHMTSTNDTFLMSIL